MNKMFNLSALMRNKNITQLVLSLEIGVSQETISAYLNGKAKPSADNLIKLANYFNTSIDYLLDRTNVNIKVNDMKPSTINDKEFILLSKYRSLSNDKKLMLDGYMEGISNI
ncbi:MAG: helix-turn-helix transcriptional regulator [Bacilli bacterium]